jgi:hypothetical protein
MVDPGREVCDTGYWSCRANRYHWTVTVFGEPDPVAAGRTGKLAEARSRAEGGARSRPFTDPVLVLPAG